MKLIKHEMVNGVMTCLTGCRIGGAESGFEIAGIDNPILKNPLNGLPYVPGSSIKGKIRSLLELKHNKISVNKKGEQKESWGPCECGNDECFICSLFGCGNARNTNSPTRIIFRDSFMTEQSIKEVGAVLKDFAELKTEVKIDRRTSTSADPRDNYRIPAGAEFNIEFSIRYFDGDNRYWNDWRCYLAEGFELLENDYLGGCGTRGYGKVKITRDGQPMSEYLRSLAL